MSHIPLDGSIIIALVSVIGTIAGSTIIWYLNFRSVRSQFEVKGRAGYIQEILRDNYKLFNFLRQITMRQQIKGNVHEVQQLMDARPYNFNFQTINKWVEARYELESKDSIGRITELMTNTQNRICVYEEMYTRILQVGKDDKEAEPRNLPERANAWMRRNTVHIIMISLTVLGTYVAILAYQTTFAHPDIKFDVIPSEGYLDEHSYHTQIRPVNEDIAVDFYVVLWNMGDEPATDILVTLRQIPQTSVWYDYDWSTVSFEGFSYRATSNTASIKVLLPSQQAQVQYHIRFTPSLYDNALQQGEEPKIIVEINAPSIPQPIRREYLVQIP